MDHSATKLFLACISGFWVACGNAAPDLARERAIFERERFVGLNVGSYLFSKLVWLWLISILQATVLFGDLKLVGGLRGSASWQFLALGSTCLATTANGMLISSWSRSVLQAVLLVPGLTIPQILFSGYVFKLQDWNEQPVARILSSAFPGFVSQRIVHSSMMRKKPVINYSDMDEAGLVTSYENLCTGLIPFRVWLYSQEATIHINEDQVYSEGPAERPLKIRDIQWNPKTPPAFRLGCVYAWADPALNGLFLLLLWSVVWTTGTYTLLRRQSG